MLQDLASKTNPLTGKSFTPFEAYKFACWEKGLDNLLVEKQEKPKPVPSADMAKAATRPSGSKNDPPKKEEEADEVSDILSQYL
jgi:ribosomal protein L12E/L44/L45/RPP1/RPP2